MIDYDIHPDFYEEITVEEAEKHEEFVNALNYLISENFIEAEEDESGEIRLYPTTRT